MELDERQILNIVATELQQSAGGNDNGFIDANRQAALATYLGQPDGKEIDGRSKVVSTDVADAIEWIMPEIMKAFTQNNEVVIFDPCTADDAEQAELESRFTYDILMKDNNGFLVLHQLVKDALMQKNGFVKVFYEDCTEVFKESYTGLTDLELEAVLSKPDVEMIELTTVEEEGINIHSVKVQRVVKDKRINVISVPPEEFRGRRNHNSIDLSGIPFSAHVLLTTAGELVKQGYDKDLIDSIPTSQTYESDREYRFYMQGETVYPDRDNSLDPSLRPVEIAECYMKIDLDGDGIAEFAKVTVSGGDNPDVLLDIEEIDSNPFISATAILMSHKLFGLSIYDRLKQIQEQKTALWRNILDNMYLQNNQRTIVLEGQVRLDDVMMSRPGGIIRASAPGAVTPYVTPPLSAEAYKMMDYLDRVREGRAGVSPEGAFSDSRIGDRVGSEGVDRLMSQKEELVGLMIRVIAETGIKPLCYKIREQAMKHLDVVREYSFKGQWVKVDPTKWRSRKHSTVRVGTGSGNRQQQLNAIAQLLLLQEKALANPSQSLVQESQIFNAINDFAKFSGLPGADRYFIDPSSPQGKEFKQKVEQQTNQNQQMMIEKEKIMLDAQMKVANAQEQLVRVEAQNNQLKNQIDVQKNEISLYKQRSDNELKYLQQQLSEAKAALDKDSKNKELQFKYDELREKMELERERIHSMSKQVRNTNESE